MNEGSALAECGRRRRELERQLEDCRTRADDRLRRLDEAEAEVERLRWRLRELESRGPA